MSEDPDTLMCKTQFNQRPMVVEEALNTVRILTPRRGDTHGERSLHDMIGRFKSIEIPLLQLTRLFILGRGEMEDGRDTWAGQVAGEEER